MTPMIEASHIVVVDDDLDTREELHDYLSDEGYRVSTADGGVALDRILAKDAADLIVLDLMMPGEHGLAIASRLRKASNVGIIILTGKGDPVDRVVGLELGADDFVSKPCDLRELVARVRSVLRRVEGQASHGADDKLPVLSFAGWTLDLSTRRLTSSDAAEVPLTTGEFDLLAGLATNANKVVSRERLLDIVYSRNGAPFDRAIDNLVSRLRRRIEADPKQPKLIKTVRGVGYMFSEKVTRA